MESLVYLAIIWLSVFVASVLADKTRLTPVLYFLAVGAVLVNIGVLPVETDHFIRGLAEIGIIVIMFALGFEESSSNFVKSLKRSWGIAFFGGLAPFCTAFAVAQFFWHDLNISIMSGLAMTATAISLTMVSLKSENLHKTKAATGIMTSAVLDDIASLVLVAILVPMAAGQGAVSALGVGLILAKAVGFFVVVVLLAQLVFPHVMSPKLAKIPIIGRYGIIHVLGFGRGEHATLTVLLVALLSGLLAHKFGFHPAVGAYMSGLILKEDYFLIRGYPKVNYYEETKKIIDNVAFSWIGPVFFVVLGTKIIFDWDMFVSVIPEMLVLTVGIFIAQISSAALAARYMGKFKWEEAMMIGFGMLGRAELAFVVLDIAYIQNQILSTEAFYTLMFTAFWLNVSVPITIKLWKPRFEASQK